ncbi:hypothetical protein EIN_323240 [Entamoeba invadens IP1]|uniref:Leucine rich repeat containing protein BspA family protein n=1 Tax=Entamoeba invadens IP1 TaxID=370355 RepID=L7FLJ1_ENTIV|nr:hypothetical protein EIN_323240 [Entamoeba invadens IP1]ELP88597.1 hypothetical protein EIN_323240 [Entamoeba invadens IP1]|eukprot:XP_004255368.1 hypothetical protein EIN_323240 [Entamoeba invadens IP1]
MVGNLEEFFLMNVVLYIDTFNSLLTFSTINKKCKRAMERLQINPLVVEKTREVYHNHYDVYLSHHYAKDMLKLFSNIKTLYLPSYRIEVPESVFGHIEFIKVVNMNDREYEIEDDTRLNDYSKFPIVSTAFPFATIHQMNMTQFQSYVIYSIETLDYLVKNIENMKNLEDLTIVVPEVVEETGNEETVENISIKLLQTIKNKLNIFLELHNMKMLRIISSGKGQLQHILPLIQTKGGLVFNKVLYLMNEEMTEEDSKVFEKIKIYFKVMFMNVKNYDKFSAWELPISFFNIKTKININENELPFYLKYSLDACKGFEEITIYKMSEIDLDLSQIDVKKLAIETDEYKHFKSKIVIPQTLKYLVINNKCEMKFCCCQNIEIEVYKEMKVHKLVPFSICDAFQLPIKYDILLKENDYIDYCRENPDSVEDIPKFYEMPPEEQKNYKIFVKLVEELEILKTEEKSVLIAEKVLILNVPKTLTEEVNIKQLTSCELNSEFFILNDLPNTLSRISLRDINTTRLNLTRFDLKELFCEKCNSLTIDVQSCLKSIDLKECYNLKFTCDNGAAYLTHFDAFHTIETSGKNIVVDYNIQYKEQSGQGPSWMDSVGFYFNYIKGMTFLNQPYTCSANGYSSPNVNEKPHIPANIFCDLMCCGEVVGSIWYKAIKEIGDFCFENADFYHDPKVELSDGFSYFGIGAFCEAKNIVKIALPLGIKKLPFKAFYNVTSLTEIESKESQLEIDDYSLFGCKKLVKHPKFVPSKIVQYCEKYLINFCELKTIEVKSGVTNLKEKNYSNCTILQEIKLPATLKFVGDNCFVGCTNLKNIIFEKNVVFGKHLCFANLVLLEKFVLPTTLTKIRNFMFKNCQKLSQIEVCNSVIKIGDMAFYECSSLTKFVIPNSVTKIGFMCFKNCTSLVTLCCPSNLKLPKSTLNGTYAKIISF